MLYSYYDCYLNDCIIKESYEVTTSYETNLTLGKLFKTGDIPSSPGIENDYYKVKDKKLCDNSYYATIMQSFNSNFHLYLLYLTLNNGVYTKEETRDRCGFYMSNEELIKLNSIYSNLYNLNIELKCVDSSDSNFESKAIKLIKSGTPLIFASYNEIGGHYMIAYDYNDNSTSLKKGLFVHRGYHDGTYHVSLEDSQYSKPSSFLYLDVSSLKHSCSNNYLHLKTSYCTCNISLHEEHYHVSNTGYNYGNDTYHYSQCNKCGEYFYQSHSLTGVLRNHYMVSYCPICSYESVLYDIYS